MKQPCADFAACGAVFYMPEEIGLPQNENAGPDCKNQKIG